MDKTTSRRDLFKFAGGSAVGILFTPAPWRLVTDTALWSQNWSWIPKPQRGETRIKFTNCALCPAGCAVRARCIEDQPVGLAGVAGHPLSRGALCPFGITGHHLPYHPARVKQATHRGAPVSLEHALAELHSAVARRGDGESLAVLDLRPGRTASWTIRRALAGIPNSVYIPASAAEGATARAMAASMAQAPLAIDLEGARSILSLGTPLLDGWGTPGNVLAARGRFRLIQAEPVESRTAVLADTWLAVNPGSEAALALSVANVLLAEGLVNPEARRAPDFERFAAMAAGFPPEMAAVVTGLDPKQIVDTARDLARNAPALVLADSAPGAGPLSGEELQAVAALNVLLGAAGRSFVGRHEAPVPADWKNAVSETALSAVSDHSVRVLLIDESLPGELVPWSVIQRKLARENATVAVFACSANGYGRFADYVLPTPVFPEFSCDMPAAVDSPVAAFRISVPLVAPPPGVVEPAAFVAKLAGQVFSDPLEQRARSIHEAGKGELYSSATRQSTPLKEVKAEDFWKALQEGGCWLDVPDKQAKARLTLLGGHPAEAIAAAANRPADGLGGDLPLVAMPAGPRGASAGAPASPLMSKLYQESDLRQSAGQVVLNPVTAGTLGLEDGAAAVLQTRCGKCAVRVALDGGVRPGVVQIAGGTGIAGEPTVFDVCDIAGDGTWRMTRAKVVRA